MAKVKQNSARGAENPAPVLNGTPTGAQTFAFSRFNSKSDNSPKPSLLPWRGVCDLLEKRRQTARDDDRAKDGEAIGGASYPAQVWRRDDKPKDLLNERGEPFRYNEASNPTPEDWRAPFRANEFVEAVSLAILDFDNGTPQNVIEAGAARLNSGDGAAAFIYSTWSHTPDAPKFRVVFPLASPVEASDWPDVWARLALAFDGAPDIAAKDAARLHFLPSCPKSRALDAVAVELSGAALDVSSLPELPEPARPKSPPFDGAASGAGADRYAQKAFKNECGRVCNAAKGDRNNALNRAALALGHFIGAARLERGDAEAALMRAASAAGLKEDEARATIKSGLDAGEQQPNWKGTPGAVGAPKATRRGADDDRAQNADGANEIPAPSMRTERGAAEYEPGQLVELLRPGWECAALSTHASHAARIIETIGGDLRFSPQLGWLTFTGRHWERDDRHATQTADRTKGLSQTVRDEAATLYELAGVLLRDGRALDAEAMGKAALQHMKHAKQVETKNFLEGALHFAAGNSLVRVKPDAFDQRPWLLGFENSVWDAGEWREHRRADLLLNLCPVDFIADADPREWARVLDVITGGDAEFARTLQDAAGYILSGASHLRFLPWLYGPKGTGKSTFAELLQTVLGRMAATIDPKKLQDDSARERLGADLWNRRLAVCAEAGGQRLEAELLKTLSGADTLTVRFLYQEAFDALPRHVLLMVSNDAPRLDAYDDALKDRVVALPFVHRLDAGGPLELTGGARIEAVRKDPTSPLVRGFTAWALEGLARVHQTQSIFRAPCIESATAKFWADTDPLTPFWETVSANDLRAGIANGDLRVLYEKWCEIEGLRPNVRGKAWAKACESRGLESYRTPKARGWRMAPNDTMTEKRLFPESPQGTLQESRAKGQNDLKGVIVSSFDGDREKVQL